MEIKRDDMNLTYEGELDDKFFDLLGKYSSGIATRNDVIEMTQYIVDLIEPSRRVKVVLDDTIAPDEQGHYTKGSMNYNSSIGTLTLSGLYLEEIINKRENYRDYLAVICHEMRHYYQHEILEKMEKGNDDVKNAIDEYSKRVASSLYTRYIKSEEVDMIFNMLGQVGFQTPYIDYTDEMKKNFAANVAFAQYSEVKYEKDARSIMSSESMKLIQRIINDERCPLWVSTQFTRELISESLDGNPPTFSYGREVEDLFSNFYSFMDRNLQESLPMLESIVQKLYMEENMNNLNTNLIKVAAEEQCLKHVLNVVYSEKSNEDLLDAYVYATVSGCKLLGDTLIPIIMTRTTAEERKETQEKIVKFLKSNDATRNSYIINHFAFLTEEQYVDVLNDLLSKDRLQQVKFLLNGDKEYHEGFVTFNDMSMKNIPRAFVENFCVYMKGYVADCKRRVPKHSLSNIETLLDIATTIQQHTGKFERYTIPGYRKMISIAQDLVADKGIGKKLKSRMSESDFRAQQDELSKSAYSTQYNESIEAHDKHMKALYDQKSQQDENFETQYASKQQSAKKQRDTDFQFGAF